MFRSLMVPVDGSAFAEHALGAAREVARGAGAVLHLVRVHQPPVQPGPNAPIIADAEWLEALKVEERKYLEELRGMPLLREVRTATSLVQGFPAQALTEYARAHAIDLIVMTTHGRGGVSRFWLGSVADGLVRQAGTPVLLIRPDEDVVEEAPAAPPMRHILVPTDGSALSRSVLEPGLALGALTGARFTLLRVLLPLPPLPPAMAAAAAVREAEMSRHERQRAVEELEAIAAPLREGGRNIECAVLPHPHPAVAIIEYAATNSVDAIALATHGRGGWARLALGSVSDKVMRGSGLPVLLYRPAEPRDEQPGDTAGVRRKVADPADA